MAALNLLYANDEKAQFPRSWYAATAHHSDVSEPLQGDLKADVCIIGAGYTGLSAALHFAQAGRKVVLLEAHRVGFGASGRNGGHVGDGPGVDQRKLISVVGREDAAIPWHLAEDAKALVKTLIEQHKIDCDLKPGILHTGYSPLEMRELHEEAEWLDNAYGYDRIECLDVDACHDVCPSPAYAGGILDHGAAHLHPLNYALGLAKAARAAGAEVIEQSEVVEIDQGPSNLVKTKTGSVQATHIILACNGYHGDLNNQVTANVMPINNYIAATAPLGAETATVLKKDVAVSDSKFVVNYFRLSGDNRLLFGGGETYGYRFPSDIAALVRKPMCAVFPHLVDVPIEYAWGGTLAITMRRMPYVARVGQSVLSASGYSGHGVGTATHAGKLMALAIQGETDGFDTLARVPSLPFPGGPALRSPLLILAMTWYAMRDRLGL